MDSPVEDIVPHLERGRRDGETSRVAVDSRDSMDAKYAELWTTPVLLMRAMWPQLPTVQPDTQNRKRERTSVSEMSARGAEIGKDY